MELKPGYKWTEGRVIPQEWKVKRLGELASVSSGGTPSRSNPRYWNGDIPWVTTSELDFHTITEVEQFITKEGLENSAARLLPPGTLLMALYGQGKTRGKISVLGTQASTNQACAAISLNLNISQEYIFHFLASNYGSIRNLSNTGNQENLNGSIVRSIPILLPPEAEQRAIAMALNDVDALIGTLDQLIAKRRDLKQAAMQQLLTGQHRLPGFTGDWKVRRFGDLFQFLNTANNPRADLSTFGTVGYIHYGDIHTTTSAFLDCSESSSPFIAKERAAGIPFVEDGDLVMADASEDYVGIGKCIEVQKIRGRKIVAGLHTFLLRGNKELLADGFKGYLQFIPSLKAALIRFATGISVYGVSKNNVRSVEVELPKPDEQTAIATVLSDMDAEIAALERRRDKTRALKQGIMQELLTGRTRLV
jgi:type I restriction enzyme S subunit